MAPIALYPDELLANVLAASTYPLEVVQADRWLKEHKSLKGDALKAEVDKQAWDDSVKALASTPDVLTMMSDKLDWTKKLGDAVLAQQPDVMDAIQRLRTQGAGQQQARHHQAAEGQRPEPGKQAGHRDPAGRPDDDLRALLRSGHGLRRVALCGISAVLLRLSRPISAPA